MNEWEHAVNEVRETEIEYLRAMSSACNYYLLVNMNEISNENDDLWWREIKTKLVLSIQSRKEVNVKREDEDPNS